MAYIGKSPTIGNFQKCDAISVVNGQATYALTVGGSAVFPESSNHVLCSLNGILQAPQDSFSISSSNIVFASNLATGDVIDFVMILGNVLDLGVPSDATVTNAKTNFVSTSSAAGLQIKGDNTTAGTLQLNCEQNSHGVKLRSPAHSSGQSYTLTLPTGNVTADKFLKVASVSGSGTTGIGQLSFADGGITEADIFRLTTNLSSSADPISSNLERADDASYAKIGTGMSVSSGVFSFPTTGLYWVQVKSKGETNGSQSDLFISATTDNGSSYDQIAVGSGYGASNDATYIGGDAFFNVTDVSTHKIKFHWSAGSGSILMGSTARNDTVFIFIRIGDSQ